MSASIYSRSTSLSKCLMLDIGTEAESCLMRSNIWASIIAWILSAESKTWSCTTLGLGKPALTTIDFRLLSWTSLSLYSLSASFLISSASSIFDFLSFSILNCSSVMWMSASICSICSGVISNYCFGFGSSWLKAWRTLNWGFNE